MMKYLANFMPKYSTLDTQMERTLLEQMAAGGELGSRARELLVLHNLKLAVHWAVKYRGRGLELEDLVSEAIIGLHKALDRFDSSYGCRFSTYAVWWIRQCINRAIDNTGPMVRLPPKVAIDVWKLGRFVQVCLHEHGRAPSQSEIMKHLKCSAEHADTCIGLLDKNYFFCDRPIIASLADRRTPSPDESSAYIELIERLNGILHRLPSRQREIISRRFGLDHPQQTLEEVAKVLGVSKERIRQLETKALAKLKALIEPRLAQFIGV